MINADFSEIENIKKLGGVKNSLSCLKCEVKWGNFVNYKPYYKVIYNLRSFLSSIFSCCPFLYLISQDSSTK